MPMPRLLLVSISTPSVLVPGVRVALAVRASRTVRAGPAVSVSSDPAGAVICSLSALWPDGLIANSVAPAIGNHHTFISYSLRQIFNCERDP